MKIFIIFLVSFVTANAVESNVEDNPYIIPVLILISIGFSAILAIQKNRNIWLHIVLGILLPIIWPMILSLLKNTRDYDKRIRCRWCNSKKLTCLNAEEGEAFWAYRNKDGSQDKRINDNFQFATYITDWQCDICGAQSQFTHYASATPSMRTPVSKGILMLEGSGDRIAKNFAFIDNIYENKKSENRKSEY